MLEKTSKTSREIPEYPRVVAPEWKPYDPLELAKETEKIVCRNNERKYTAIYCAGVYGGIATAYVVGCCLRCIFCWVDLSRDYPERYGEFLSPEKVYAELERNALSAGFRKLRISGGEPTICKQHLLRVLELVEASPHPWLFVLETNGILFGADKEYAKQVAGFKKVYCRVSFKAGTSEGFEKRTGAQENFFELPFKGLRNLLDAGAYARAAAMSDSRLMPAEERTELIRRLHEINPRIAANLEEEVCDPYEMTKARLHAAGWKFKW